MIYPLVPFPVILSDF